VRECAVCTGHAWGSSLCWGLLCGWRVRGVRGASMQVGKDKDVGYDPCSVSYFSNGEYICVGGTNRQVGLVTKEGTRLTNISEHEAWCAPRPRLLLSLPSTSHTRVATASVRAQQSR
jgi:hypothetical protein